MLSLAMAAVAGVVAVSWGGKAWLLLGLAGLFGFLGVALLPQLLGRGPALAVGPDGVTARLFNGHTIPWSEIADVQYGSVQGQHILTFVLRPDSPGVLAHGPCSVSGPSAMCPSACCAAKTGLRPSTRR